MIIRHWHKMLYVYCIQYCILYYNIAKFYFKFLNVEWKANSEINKNNAKVNFKSLFFILIFEI